MYSILIGKDENICANCKHFFPHYVKAENRFVRLREGHCNYPRLKTRDIYCSCEHFELTNEEQFVALRFEEVK